MPRVTTVNIFCVERILVRWVAECSHYEVVLQGEGDEHGETVINAWRDHGKALAPELIVEWAPPVVLAPEVKNPPNQELDL